jgi:DNA-binding MarR family transcriptional regulator
VSKPPAARSTALSDLQAELRVQALRSVTLHSAVAGRLGIAVTDFNCLNLLSLEGPQTPGQLADRIGITRGGAITTMIDRLEAAGYVRRRRDQTDRRRVVVELVADVARTSISRLFATFGTAVSAHLDSYNDQELQLLLGFVGHLNDLTREATTTLREGGNERRSHGGSR